MDSSALKYVIPKLNKINNNNNAIALTPNFSFNQNWDGYGVLIIDPTLSNTFTVNLDGLTPKYTNQTIDNRVDVEGRIQAYLGDLYYFAININQELAVQNPGLEFTVFFNNPPTSSCYVGVYPDTSSNSSEGADLLSPGNALAYFPYVTITLKSDGSRFRVVSTSPGFWSGAYD